MISAVDLRDWDFDAAAYAPQPEPTAMASPLVGVPVDDALATAGSEVIDQR